MLGKPDSAIETSPLRWEGPVHLGMQHGVHSEVASFFTKIGRACSGQEGGEGSLVASMVQAIPAAADELPLEL